ncbi:Integral membrane protein DGCR2/IDD [Papilio machaon]|uniref:Integral membrane protein DGCR2/IDD n=1 Tax=Papilio machaon TaxID=76193 RepID=A0A194RNE1_PAPMA|nr:Integral membrane protein DGCR2/IDD [Papilio machaon]
MQKRKREKQRRDETTKNSRRMISIAAQGECTDLRGRHISHGLHYVPGPDTCTLCVCDNGLPKVCKAVLCSPPQDCRSFRVGNTCCEFICLDDVVKPAEGEAGVRVAAGGAAALVVATVALVVYRVRTHKRRRPPRLDDQRSLTSIGYISGSMGYMGGTCETALAAWKPPSNYLPRGEAPPPYDEAVAQCRVDSMRMNNESFHRSYAGVEGDMQCSGHAYVNVPRPVQQIANTQSCYNAPLLQAVHAADGRDPPIVPHHALPSNVVGFPSTIRLTGSLGAISGRGVSVGGAGAGQTAPPPPAAPPHADHERPHNVPGFYTHLHPIHTSLHRTIPRISTGMETSLSESVSGFLRADSHRVCVVTRVVARVGVGGAAAGEDADDYRSECENCKSATSSRWVLEEGWDGEEEEGGTQTLQRRAPPPAPPPPATATLPQPVTKLRYVCHTVQGGGAKGIKG